MAGFDVSISTDGVPVRLQLGDFNRLRWTVEAVRMNPGVLGNGLSRSAYVVDSLLLLSEPSRQPAGGASVVLWDGLNTFAALKDVRADVVERSDIRFLYVGAFPEAAVGFASNSAALYPERLPVTAAGLAGRVVVPMWVGAMAAFRRWARPVKNAGLSFAGHRQLQAGGCLVFCGLVRPSATVLAGFFRGASLFGLHSALRCLVDLDWRGPIDEVRVTLRQAYKLVREQAASSPSDFAALYSVVNMLHRMGTLAALNSMTSALFVNEFGLQRHFDPYDARGYCRNLFIDFGSTRGRDLVYPRTVDLWLNSKRVQCLRFLAAGEHLATFLRRTDAAAYWAMCETHAEALLAEWQLLPGVKGTQ